MGYIHHFAITFEDVDELGGFAVPDEEVAVIGAGDNVFVVEAEEVYVFDGLYITVSAVDACV